TAATHVDRPSLHDALPIWATPDAVPLVIQNFGSGPKGADAGAEAFGSGEVGSTGLVREFSTDPGSLVKAAAGDGLLVQRVDADRSEEHTSELQSRENLVRR